MSNNMVRKPHSVCTNFQRSSATMNILACAGVTPSREAIGVAEYWRRIRCSVMADYVVMRDQTRYC